jgi:hypothetical protein
MVKSKPVLTIRANAEGIKTSKQGKPEKSGKFVGDWASFRAKLPVKKEE